VGPITPSHWLGGCRRPKREPARSALIAICDVRPWSILMGELGLPRLQVRATLIVTIRRLLGED